MCCSVVLLVSFSCTCCSCRIGRWHLIYFGLVLVTAFSGVLIRAVDDADDDVVVVVVVVVVACSVLLLRRLP